MAKSKETQVQARKRRVEAAGRRFGVFMRKALKLADECNVDHRKVFMVFAEEGIPAGNLQTWRDLWGDRAAVGASIPDVNWDKLIEQLSPMIEKMLEQSAKAR